jgi:membrane protein YdbS with pleckstrin-like domain
LDTPQGLCLLLSLPVCTGAALAAAWWPAETRPLFLSVGPGLFLVTPVLAFLYLVWFGAPTYASSWFTTLIVFGVVASPFILPYLRTP